VTLDMSTITEKLSSWECDACNRALRHGEFRYNCTGCDDYDHCEQCATTLFPPHSHRMVRELAYGRVENMECARLDMATDIQSAMALYEDRHCMDVRDMYGSRQSWSLRRFVLLVDVQDSG
jgi:ssDNA-binding Zn-finger/Zn-ribbon topoisomerase 1